MCLLYFCCSRSFILVIFFLFPLCAWAMHEGYTNVPVYSCVYASVHECLYSDILVHPCWIVFFFNEDPIYLQALVIHSANGVKGEDGF
jgi:hypothetical protein